MCTFPSDVTKAINQICYSEAGVAADPLLDAAARIMMREYDSARLNWPTKVYVPARKANKPK